MNNIFKKSMVAFMLIFSSCLLLVSSCTLRDDPSKKEIQDKDSSLKTLVIRHSSNTLKSLTSPIEANVTVQLKKAVTVTDYIEVIVTAKDINSKITFDNDSEHKNAKKYTSFIDKVNIRVENGKKISKYTITFLPKAQEGGDALLESLVIKQGGVSVASFNKPANGEIDASLTVELNKKINDTDFVEVIATATDNTATIEIDDEELSEKKYTALPTEAIEITVTNGSNVATHTLTLKDSTTPPPDPPNPPAPSKYTVKCNVIDSVGGTNIKGVKIDAYEAGESTVVETKTSDVAGNAYFNVTSGKNYDFVLSKKGRAASRVENVFVDSSNAGYLSIPMREWAVGTKAIAPKIGKVELLNNNSGSINTVDANTEINCAVMTSRHYLYFTTTSLSGEIIPIEYDSSGIFNVAMNIDSTFTSDNDLGKVWVTKFTQGNGKLVTEESDGSLKQQWGFSLGGLMVANGKATIHFVCYDQGGNRCERQEIVKFKNGSIGNAVNTQNSFLLFNAKAERYYRSLKTYGMPHEAGSLTSCKVSFTFKFNSLIEIGRVDVFRRPYEEGNITQHWEKVYTKQYRQGYKGYDYEQVKGIFILSDDSGTLEEGKTYQYKLVAHSRQGKIESDVATLRIMEAFNLFLVSPLHRQQIDLKNVKNTDFSFKISDPSLWNKERADYFSFDVLVTKDMTASSGSSQRYGVCFASKCKYYFNRSETDALYIQNGTSYQSYKNVVGSGVQISDLMDYKNGLVTLKAKFMNANRASLGLQALKDTIREAGMYYWDVQSFYKDDALDANRNKAAYFVKEYALLDSTTGEEKSGKVSTSYSYANIDRASGAINGRSLFIVKN